MLFNSPEYALFLPVVLLLFYMSSSGRRRRQILLVASYVFYGAWDWRFLGLIWFSTAVDYVIARVMARASRPEVRRRLLLVSLTANIGVLGAFKYFDFFADSAAALASTLGFDLDQVTLSVLLPVGISFYTFQTLSYTIDVFRGRIEPERDLEVFALYVAFFPQLVAGPIERAERLLPQLRDLPGGNRTDISDGTLLIARGLFKKVVIADGVSSIADTVFSSPGNYDRVSLLVGVLAFTLQIYGDFSGYTDIARGSARLLGVDLIENFTQPYLARSITEFWRRWHISLSDWLRDYLYIPLGGNRRGDILTYRNLMATMLLGGLWHGASWAFIVWGGIHGVWLALERKFSSVHSRDTRSRAWVLPTMVVVMAAWIPFRAGSLDATSRFISAIIRGGGLSGLRSHDFVVLLIAATCTVVLDLTARRSMANPLIDLRPAVRGFAYAISIVLAVVLSAGADPSFLYFQF